MTLAIRLRNGLRRKTGLSKGRWESVMSDELGRLVGAGGAEASPVLKPAREFVVAHGRQGAAFARIPTPHHQFVCGDVIERAANHCLGEVAGGSHMSFSPDHSRIM